MAPQQNSTFIEDDSILRPKLHSLKNTEEEKIIERYSPIMPPINTKLNETEEKEEDINAKRTNTLTKTRTRTNEILNGQKYQHEFNEAPKKFYQNYQKQFRYGNVDGNGIKNGNGSGSGNGNYAHHTAQRRQTQRSRSISLHGANSTLEQEQKEILIWIANEPRYVSGVTKKTTCNDIIKALVDDEIQNGNFEFLKGVHKQCRHSKDGGDGVCATSRDYSDYVITECWRGIERSYDGNMTILPVWKAWSRVYNELRLMLRRRNEIHDPIQYTKPHQRPNLIRKCLSKLNRLWRKEKPEDPNRPSKIQEIKENYLLSNKAAIPDEFLFVILPDNVYDTAQLQSGRLHSIPEQSTRPTAHKQRANHRSIHRNHKTTASRKKHERGVSGVSANECIRRRHLTATANSISNSVRYRLAQKTSEMNTLYAREYALTRKLSEKCKLHRLQNQIYSNPDQQWNISIGQVQRKIENYAQEIVRTEHELLELKNEIKQDISLINNLKRMTLERGGNKQKITSPLPAATTTEHKKPTKHECSQDNSKENKKMQFVDNIYEFCDNNASMLV